MFKSRQSRGSCADCPTPHICSMILDICSAHEAGPKPKQVLMQTHPSSKHKQTKRPQQWFRPTYKLVTLLAQVSSKGRSQHFLGSSRLWLWLLDWYWQLYQTPLCHPNLPCRCHHRYHQLQENLPTPNWFHHQRWHSLLRRCPALEKTKALFNPKPPI